MLKAPSNRDVRLRPIPMRRLRILAALAAAGFSMPSHALGLMASYHAALEHDPTFRGARFEREAGEEYEAIGRANLLPNVSLSYSYVNNDAERSIANQAPAPLKYDSRASSVSLRQPLFNLDAWQRYKGGQAQASYSEAKFDTSWQDLISRLTAAYLDALLAEDQLRLALAQRDAYLENQLANEKMFEKGAGTRTDMIETRARHELAEAAVIEAQNNVANKRHELTVIVGSDPGALDTLGKGLPELPMPFTLAEWEQMARERNPEVRAQRHSVQYAHAEVGRNQAGHYPRVDLVASYSNNISDPLYTANQSLTQDTTVKAVGVQMVLPLYSGGGVSAQTRQAAARLASNEAELDSALQKSLVEVRKQFQQFSSSRLRMQAMEQAERSATEAVEATRKSVAGGQRVNLDVLTALQQLYTTRRDLSDARHGYLLAYLKLHAAAGALDEQSLGRIAACFRPAE